MSGRRRNLLDRLVGDDPALRSAQDPPSPSPALGLAEGDVRASSHEGLESPSPARRRGGSGGYMGRVLRDAKRSLDDELEELRAEVEHLKAGAPVQQVDPNRIRRSKIANRHAASFQGRAWDEFKASIADGQLEPILVRPVANDPDHDFEVAYGHRRHRACLELGIPVRAIVREMDDATLAKVMLAENQQREATSAFEEGLWLARLLDERVFPSARALSAELGVSLAHVSRLTSFAKLPDEIVSVFPNPLEIRVRWVKPLLDAWAHDPDHVREMAASLVKGDSSPPSALRVFETLTQPREAVPRERLVARGTAVMARLSYKEGRGIIRLAKEVPESILREMLAVCERWVQSEGKQ